MLKKCNDFYPFITDSITNNELKNTALLLINQPKNKLELINKVIYQHILSSLQKAGNQALKEKSKQIQLKIEQKIQNHK